jgi:hypothetical protein
MSQPRKENKTGVLYNKLHKQSFEWWEKRNNNRISKLILATSVGKKIATSLLHQFM